MTTLILSVLGLGLGIAVSSPVSVVAVIILLTLPSGRLRAVAVVVGWLAAIAVIAVITLFALHGQDFSSHKTTPSRTASVVEIVIGSIVLVASGRAFRRRAKHAGSVDAPRWLERLDHANWLFAVLLGALLLTYSLTVAAAAEILKAHLGTANAAVAFVVFALASITTISAPIVLVFVAPARSTAMLATWRAWLLGNARAVGLVVLMVVGALLIIRGSHDLIT